MKFKRCMTILACRLPFLLGTLALLIFFTGGKPAAAATPAFVRIIHASPDVGTADVFVDGSVLLSSFQFGAITDYAAIPPGPHKVQIALVGKGVGGSLITQTLAVSPGIAYTVAATGTQATGLGLEVFIDDNVVSGNMAKVRVYHLSPDAGNLSVSDGSSTILNGITYRQASGYVSIPAQPYTFNVSGGSLSNNLSVAVTAKADTITSIFAVGLVNGTPNIQLVSTEANGTPSLPNTGSDPHAVASTSTSGWQAFTPWLLGILLIVVIGIGTASLGKDIVRQITGLRSGR
jgi:hypothetical protein